MRVDRARRARGAGPGVGCFCAVFLAKGRESPIACLCLSLRTQEAAAETRRERAAAAGRGTGGAGGGGRVRDRLPCAVLPASSAWRKRKSTCAVFGVSANRFRCGRELPLFLLSSVNACGPGLIMKEVLFFFAARESSFFVYLHTCMTCVLIYNIYIGR